MMYQLETENLSFEEKYVLITIQVIKMDIYIL